MLADQTNIEKINIEKINTDLPNKTNPKVNIHSVDTLVDYVDRNKQLATVIIKLDMLDSIKAYVQLIKKNAPFGAELRLMEYILNLAKLEREKYDLEVLTPIIESRNISLINEVILSLETKGI